ncbi:hypothetical protein A2U01_0002570, partial [Trifolium medium]|nr:hypothetical protein [Trifolium medium]
LVIEAQVAPTIGIKAPVLILEEHK